MSTRYVQNPWLTDVITTADATQTVSSTTSYVIPTGAFGRVQIIALAKTATGIASTTVVRSFRNISGVLTLAGALGTIEALGGDAALGTIVVDVTSTGTTIQPRVQGILATSIEWLLDVRYWIH